MSRLYDLLLWVACYTTPAIALNGVVRDALHQHGSRSWGRSNITITTFTAATSQTPTLPAPQWNTTSPISTTLPSCIPLDEYEPSTIWVVVHTETVTISGSDTSWTPPYAPLVTPVYCRNLPTAPGFYPPPAYTMPAAEMPTDAGGYGTGEGLILTATKTRTGAPHKGRPIVTLTTTDKNPAVVSGDPIPDYIGQPWDNSGAPANGRPEGGSWWAGNGPNKHNSNPGRPGPKGGDSNDDIISSRPPFTVSVGFEDVVINDSTFHHLLPDQTTVVVVDQGTFTIFPTAVVGEGATVVKTPPPGGVATVVQPVETQLGGEPVRISGSQVVVIDKTIDLPTIAITTSINGVNVVVEPSRIVVGHDTLTFSVDRPHPTNVIVMGGDTVTAIGPSIIELRSSIYTYGQGIPATTVTVDGRPLVIEASGAVVDGVTIGGPSLPTTASDYVRIGGVTVTVIESTAVVIDGRTFSIGPGATEVTTVIGTETIRIGPDGIALASTTLAMPFDIGVVTTISPSGTWANIRATETGASTARAQANEDDPNGNTNRDEDERINVNGVAEDDDSRGASVQPITRSLLSGLVVMINYMLVF
ncbi:hypothetical protein S40285_06681 [Stachybotrys chlorohalonatus IBT 40285]|uniref:Uncharacterized protein n=1 Tax=Stachybotrys chlorohalonatus (strain IBT 40285) TaxID=1283841 RepID=A0A084QA34_STAC4|nr:hypothetical protein S40285_06681 [Stachybotrys chlorohalonata IBT 40285]